MRVREISLFIKLVFIVLHLAHTVRWLGCFSRLLLVAAGKAPTKLAAFGNGNGAAAAALTIQPSLVRYRNLRSIATGIGHVQCMNGCGRNDRLYTNTRIRTRWLDWPGPALAFVFCFSLSHRHRSQNMLFSSLGSASTYATNTQIHWLCCRVYQRVACLLWRWMQNMHSRTLFLSAPRRAFFLLVFDAIVARAPARNETKTMRKNKI